MEFNRDIGQVRLEKIRVNTYITFKQNHLPEVVAKNLLTYYEHVVKDNKKSSEIKIADIRGKFASLIYSFYQNCGKLTEPQRIALKLWYLYYITPVIERAVQKGSVFYIWGTGKYGTIVKEMVEVFLSGVVLSGFMDSNRTGTFWGYTIYDPKEILEGENIVVFVAVVNGQQEIIRHLKDNNMVFNSDYFILSPRSW